MKTQISFLLIALLGGGSGLAMAAGTPATQAGPRVSVELVNPQSFTDFTKDASDRTSPVLIGELESFIRRTGERYVPEGMRLDIRVTDVDLAGRLEQWRGPEFAHIRVIKPLYPPRINLEFRLTDSAGKVVDSGTRELTDPAFQMRDAFAQPATDDMRYEKDLLREWFQNEFRSVKLAGG